MVVELDPNLEERIKGVDKLLYIILEIFYEAADSKPPKYRHC
jgi:hypothetical protein